MVSSSPSLFFSSLELSDTKVLIRALLGTAAHGFGRGDPEGGAIAPLNPRSSEEGTT